VLDVPGSTRKRIKKPTRAEKLEALKFASAEARRDQTGDCWRCRPTVALLSAQTGGNSGILSMRISTYERLEEARVR
jgi:hypothetical protein